MNLDNSLDILRCASGARRAWLRRLLVLGGISAWAACQSADEATVVHSDETDPSLLEDSVDEQAGSAANGVTPRSDGVVTGASAVPAAATNVAGTKAYYDAAGPYGFVIEKNVGEAFRNTQVDVAGDATRCVSFAQRVLGDSVDPLIVAILTTLLTGNTPDADRQLYTLIRPQRMVEGQKYPVITWGNGTCGTPLQYQQLLSHLASHGFIVIGANAGWVGGGAEMRRALDFVIAENENPSSPLFGKVDITKLGVSGHSQGSTAAVVVGGDARIVTSVPIEGARAEQVQNLKGPSFLIAGELDTMVKPEGVESAFRAATVPAVFGLSIGQDHGMPGERPAAIRGAVAAWFGLHLSGDAAGRPLFYGESCGYCTDPAWRLQRNF